VRTVARPQGTRCKGPAVQSHPLPLSFWPTTCTSGRAENMREGGGEQRMQWKHANSVGERMSDTVATKISTTF